MNTFPEVDMLNIALLRTIVALAIAGSTACATKGFVRTEVGGVRESVDTLVTSLEETQERVETNEAGIRKAGDVVAVASQAADKAVEGAAAAMKLAKTAEADTAALEKARAKLLYEVVMSEQKSGFRFDSAELPDAAKTQIDELVSKLKQEPMNVFITIEGHTDSIGSAAVNERLGLERAKAVEQYLHEAHQIPLHKMDVISYGEAQPAAPNTTAGGRAQNRRVEIKVVS
jgi:outer membrane protein OmpA-like peptidoglycan-associated protein